MLTIVVTGLVLMRARRLSEVLSPSSEVWKEWELRGAVFLSLVLQVFLIFLGDRRKCVPHAWIKVVTWSAYLLADSVAIYGIGMISNSIGEIKYGKSVNKMEPHAELSTFWAPFLLLHLGGPDTISAYAMEDNELWLRHSLTLVNQMGLTVYVLVIAWTNPILSFLTILILLSGFYKYGERIWVLRAASNEKFKDSLAESQPQLSNKIVEECELKGAEGYSIVPHRVIEVQDDVIADLLSQKLSSRKESDDQEYEADVGELLVAHSLVDTSQRLFADHLFGLESKLLDLSRFFSRKLLHGKQNVEVPGELLAPKHIEEAFKVIEIELSLIYDVFYTKAKAVHTSWGFICRLAISFSICVSMVVFSLQDRTQYLKADQCLTFLLLGSAIFLELYALFHILLSDQFTYWLENNKQLAVLNFVNGIHPLSKRHRWSNSIGQYNLMRCSFIEIDSCWWRFLELLHVDEMGVKFLYHDRVDVTGHVKALILGKIISKETKDEQKLLSSRIDRGHHVLSTYMLLDELKWSIELDFDMSILVWHIATELCYYPDSMDFDQVVKRTNHADVLCFSNDSLHLSRYMLHLLVMYPSMLPVGIGSVRFRDIYKETKKYFGMRESTPKGPAHYLKILCNIFNQQGGPDIVDDLKIIEACDVLRSKVKTKFNLSVTKEDKVKYVLFNGCQLASTLMKISPEAKKWDIIMKVWADMLIYAASKCKAKDHAQQMRWGGEFITHVWFLMAHYGLTDNFQMSHAPPIAEIMVNSW